ncbi:MAG TPA: N-acetylglucosamine-6-phosphate deacetylase [Chloroflexia bacterium]|nr:N-acetylglucosamine-6-phosphate deacetylase [Chloroflexia bacterium]
MSQAEIALKGNVWTEEGFRPGRVTLHGKQIQSVEFEEGAAVDPEALMITPGLIDLQINGAIGYDFTVQPDSLVAVAEALPRWGVTTFLPTYITAPLEAYKSALEYLKAYAEDGIPGAVPLGAHIEGPYLNPKFRGAHDPSQVREPSMPEVKSLLAVRKDGQPLLKLFTLAPEEPGALEIISLLAREGVLVAVGHSGATYEEGMQAFENGARCATHLFNAMPPLHHRNPGLVGAALDYPTATTNLIVDGIHLHPAIVKMIYKVKGWRHVTLVTDAMAGMGVPPGQYVLAGQTVIVDDTSARLADSPGTLAGSILTLDAAIRNMIAFTGCEPHEAVAMATLNPAHLLGLEDQKGRLAPGYDADIAVFDADFKPYMTIVGGRKVFGDI